MTRLSRMVVVLAWIAYFGLWSWIPLYFWTKEQECGPVTMWLNPSLDPKDCLED
jgi:hypothetical protein